MSLHYLAKLVIEFVNQLELRICALLGKKKKKMLVFEHCTDVKHDNGRISAHRQN